MKNFCLLFVFSLAALTLKAQPKMPTAEEMAKKNVDELTERLKLSTTQKGVVYNFAYSFAKEQLNLMKKQQSTGYNDEEMAKLYRLNNETNNSIRSVLKPEQIKEYNKIIEERLNGTDPKKKKKKHKKGEDEEVVGIEGLKSVKGLSPPL